MVRRSYVVAMVLGALLVAAACRRDTPVAWSARVRLARTPAGETVVVDVTTDPHAAVRLARRTASADHTGRARLELDAHGFAPGRHVLALEIEPERGGRRRLARGTVAFVRPEPPPRLRVVGSAAVGSGDGHVNVAGSFGQVEHVGVDADGIVRLAFETDARCAVRLRGEPVAVSADGRFDFALALESVLREAPIAALVGAASASGARYVVRLAGSVTNPENERLDGTLEVDVLPYLRAEVPRRFAQAAAGAVPLAGVPEPTARRSHSLAYLAAPGALVHFGLAGRVREVDLVAIPRALEPRAAAPCGPYGDSRVPVVRERLVPRHLVDEEVTVYAAASGTIVTRETFRASAGECPETVVALPSGDGRVDAPRAIEARPPRSRIVRWLESIARP